MGTICNKKIKISIEKCGETTEDCQLEYIPKDKLLKIKGNGRMNSYSEENQAPWNSKKDEIEKVIVDIIIKIGDNAFKDFVKLTVSSADDAQW